MNKNQQVTPRTWSWLLLFTTSGTLLCCALPITLVSLGMGTVVATMASSTPWLIALSQYKLWMFLVSGILIGLSIYAVYRPGRSCPPAHKRQLILDRSGSFCPVAKPHISIIQ